MKKLIVLFLFLSIVLLILQGCGGGSSPNIQNVGKYYIGGIASIPQVGAKTMNFSITSNASGIKQDQFCYSYPLLDSYSTCMLALYDNDNNMVEYNNIKWQYDNTVADLTDSLNGISFCKKVTPKNTGIYTISATYNGETTSTKLVIMPSYTLNIGDSIGINLSTMGKVSADSDDADIILTKNNSQSMDIQFKYETWISSTEYGVYDLLFSRQYNGETIDINDYKIDNTVYNTLFKLMLFKDKNGKIYCGSGNADSFVYYQEPKN